MNIWLSFVPGSGASFIEAILRSCTNLNTLPVIYIDSILNTKKDEPVNGHRVSKQWHPGTKYDLLNPQFESSTDNIFTPIVPMLDFKGDEVLQYIKENYPTDKHIYLGPSIEASSEFTVIAQQKTGIQFETIKDSLCSSNNWDISYVDQLERWELREYISLWLMQWWLLQKQDQWKTAIDLDYFCIDTLEIFTNYKKSVESIIDYIGCEITDHQLFDQLTGKWQNGQTIIFDQWNKYLRYKRSVLENTNEVVELPDNIVIEAMIQYHLREAGVELKCYGLNKFPNSQEIVNYYEQ